MNSIDVLDNAVIINGHHLEFPFSYDEIKAVLGEARIEIDEKHGKHLAYTYDDQGIEFDGSPEYLKNLKKKKAYKDKEHYIIGLALYVTGQKIYSSRETFPNGRYEGGLTFMGQKIDEDKMWRSPIGYGYQPSYIDNNGKKAWLHVSASIHTDDKVSLYDGERILKDVGLSFVPERPKSKVDYTIVVPDEECLKFDTFNFKLAVINELMYNREVLEPYFDIYDYMAFKKAHWNLDNGSNVRAAMQYFKDLPIPVRLADQLTEINVDGSDEIYMNIAPEWDGEDDRFDFNKLTEAELRQFKNLKKIGIFGNDKDADKLRKVCDPLGIEVEPMATMVDRSDI